MPTVKEYVKAIEAAQGIVAVAARHLGVDRSAIYKMRDSHPAIAQALEDSRERMTDMAEGKLYKKIMQDEDMTAIIFYLKTQGKRRGYIERLDIKVDQEVQRELEQLLTDLRSSLSQDAYAEIAAYLSSRVGEGAGSERQPN